jgi:hypothetical protein
MHPPQSQVSGSANGNVAVPQDNEVKCLGIHLDKADMLQEQQNQKNQAQPKIETNAKMLGRRPTLSLENKLHLDKAVLKPIWTCGGQPQIPTSKSSSAYNTRLFYLF